MNLEHDSRVQTLCRELEALPPEARGEFLDGACGGDAGLRAEVEAALVLTQATRGVFERGAARPGEALAQPLADGTRLGPWSVEHLVGRGGMGEVYAAQRADGAFQLRVAIKLLKRGLDSEAVVARFGRERRILAQLDHPNIARVLDAGIADDGRPFLAMEFVEGQPITVHARTKELPTARLLRLMITVCEAVQSAHARNIVHRDLKPGNVLVSTEGQVKLLDFGVAKALAEEDADATRMAGESILLTPSYAAPEQLLGLAVSPASDVYSLGVILYQLLTERLPHQRAGRSTTEIAFGLDRETVERPGAALRRERGRLPEPLRMERLHAVSKDLDLIVLKALHAEAGRRYGSALALADDLRRLLEYRPVLARPDSLPYRVRRFTRRNRRLLAYMGAAAAAVAAIAAGTFTLKARHEHIERLVALGQEQLVAQHAARAAAYFSAAYALGNDSVDVRFGLARAMPSVEALTAWSIASPANQQIAYTPDGSGIMLSDDGRDKPYTAVWNAADRKQRFKVDGTPAPVRASFSRDSGRALLVSKGNGARNKAHSQVLDLRSGKILLEVEGRAGPGDGGSNPVFIAADPPMERIVVVDPAAVARVWDVATQRQLLSLGPAGAMVSASFSQDGERIVTGAKDGTVTVWNSRSGARQVSVQAKPAVATSAWFADAGKLIATLGDNGALQLWDGRSGEWLGSPGNIEGTLEYATLDSTGRLLTVATAGQGPLKIWDLISQQLVPRPANATADYYSDIQFQPGGNGLLTPAVDGLRIWSREGQQLMGLLEGSNYGAEHAAYRPDGQRILTADFDDVVRMWDPSRLRGEPAFLLPHDKPEAGEESGTWWAGYSQDGRRLLSAGADGTVRIWDADSGQALSVLRGHGAAVVSASPSPDGRLLVTGSEDRTARLWDLQTGQTLRVIDGDKGDVHVVFSPAGDLFATFGYRQPASSTRIWDARTGKLVATLEGDAGAYRYLVFSPDGRLLVTNHADSVTRVWDARSGKLLLALGGKDGGGVWEAEFSQDSRRIVTAGDGNSIRIWDARDGHLLKALDGLSVQPQAAIFSHSGTLVAFGGAANMRLWNPASGQLTELQLGSAGTLAFSPDDALLAGGGDDGHVYIWSVATGHPLASWTDSHGFDVNSLVFSRDGRRLVSAGPSDSADYAYVWDLDMESRSPEQIASIIACKSAWRVDGEKLVPQTPHPETCTEPAAADPAPGSPRDSAPPK